MSRGIRAEYFQSLVSCSNSKFQNLKTTIQNFKSKSQNPKTKNKKIKTNGPITLKIDIRLLYLIAKNMNLQLI